MLLECIKDNFLSQVIGIPTRGMQCLTSTSELIADTRIGGCLGCHDNVIVEFTLLRDIGQTKSKIRKLSFTKSNIQLFRELDNKPR